MVDKCPNCGSDLTELDVFCPECGAKKPADLSVTETTAEVIPEPAISVPAADEVTTSELLESAEACEKSTPAPKKTGKKVKWWMIALPAILLIAIAVAVFWQILLVHIAPNLALVNALTNTAEAIAERNTDNLFTVFAKADDGSGKNTVDMTMDYSDETIGEMQIGMTVRSDRSTCQSLTSMGLEVAGQQMNFNLYADADFAAINLDILTGETYLGTNYETFGQDVRENDFLYELLGEDNIRTVETLLDFLDMTMSASDLSDLPQEEALPPEVYMDVLTTFFSEHKPVVASESLELEDENLDCYTLTYTISESEYGDLMVQLIDVAAEDPAMERAYISNFASSAALLGIEPEWDNYIASLRSDAVEIQEEGSGEITVVFYLYRDQVAMVDMNYCSEGIGNDGTWNTQLIFGEDAADSDIIFRMAAEVDDNESSIEIQLITAKDDETVFEQLVITANDETGETRVEMSYDWNRTTGELLIRLNAKTEDAEPVKLKMSCQLTELENGFTLQIPSFADFINEATEDAIGEDFTCALTYSVTTGAEIVVPEYIDIAKLTENDILQFFMRLYEEWEL